ncbi:MAG: CDP-2,3-bis-(O-geranylgeranyl)-sn-glycerol synthase [Candidatus Helarchaeales archaeon]
MSIYIPLSFGLLDLLWIIPIGFFYILPAYFANGGAVLMGKYFLKHPMDFGKSLPDEQRILGDGKTWGGFIGGILLGTIGGFVMWLVVFLIPAFTIVISFGIIDYMITPVFYGMNPFRGFLMSTGALVGDAIGSFIKRRFKKERGAKFPLIDQLDFMVGAILFSGLDVITMFFYPTYNLITIWPLIAFALIVTLVLHRIANILAFRLKLKKEPW